MSSGRALAIAGLLLALATVSGALGEHTLKVQLAPERLALWDMAVRYQFFQALGLLGIGLTLRGRDGGALRAAAALIAAGILLFCGSLYAFALGGPHALGVFPPLGGLAWVSGWLLYAWGVWRTWR